MSARAALTLPQEQRAAECGKAQQAEEPDHGAVAGRIGRAGADLEGVRCGTTSLRGGRFARALLASANLAGLDLTGADLTGADLFGATLTDADLSNTTLSNLRWRDLGSVKNVNIYGVKDAPDGFIAWAKQHGAVQIESDSQ